jgi:hypothetical protein
MCDPEDTWPDPHYHVGPQKHLHAVGVMTALYNTLDGYTQSFFQHYFDKCGVPPTTSSFLFLELNEQKRLDALRRVFTDCEKNDAVREALMNFLKYFQWCWDARNKIAHSERYPASFGRHKDLHLTKPLNKRSSERGYMTLDLATLRDLADKIRAGIKHAATLHIYLRCRDWPRASWPRGYEAHASEPLPEKLPIPSSLTLASGPGGELKPPPSPKSSRRKY